MGRSGHAVEQLDEALADYGAAIRLDPTDPDAFQPGQHLPGDEAIRQGRGGLARGDPSGPS